MSGVSEMLFSLVALKEMRPGHPDTRKKRQDLRLSYLLAVSRFRQHGLRIKHLEEQVGLKNGVIKKYLQEKQESPPIDVTLAYQGIDYLIAQGVIPIDDTEDEDDDPNGPYTFAGSR